MKTQPTIFKSLDPTWPWWGVSGITTDTQWFRVKRDAERFIKTGITNRAMVARRKTV
jgi:hypothetical protein